jgi:hypothetical protein
MASKAKTRYASTRLTPAEEALLTERAERAGLSPSEYFRQQLLGDEQKTLRLVLAEIREMRTICLEIQAAAMEGRPINVEVVKAIAKHAAETKYDKADEILKREKPN